MVVSGEKTLSSNVVTISSSLWTLSITPLEDLCARVSASSAAAAPLASSADVNRGTKTEVAFGGKG